MRSEQEVREALEWWEASYRFHAEAIADRDKRSVTLPLIMERASQIEGMIEILEWMLEDSGEDG